MTFAAFEATITWAITAVPPAQPPAWQATNGGYIAFSGGEQQDIIDALSELYTHSATAREVMDNIVSSGLPLRIGAHTNTGDFGGVVSQTTGAKLALQVGFNMSKIDDFYYINENGKVVKEIPAITFIHELIHADLWIANLPHEDPNNSVYNNAVLNGTNFDQDGAVLPIQNAIVQEMAAALSGWDDNTQASYFGALLDTDPQFGSDIIANKDYTFGNAIDNVRFGTDSTDDLDHSSNTINLVDLMFGFDGVDEIRAGAGDDYVYGGDDGDEIYGDDGDDTLFGEAGNDTIEGGDGNDFLDGGTVDVSGTNTLDGGAGFDIASFSASVAAITLDLTGATPGENSAENTIVSIEGFVLTEFDDVVDYESFNSIIALGDGADIVNLMDSVDFSTLILSLGDGVDTLNWEGNLGSAVFVVDGDSDDIILCDGINIASVIGRANSVVSEGLLTMWEVLDENDEVVEQLVVNCEGGLAYVGYSLFGEGGDVYVDMHLGRFDTGDFGISTGFSSAPGDLRASFENVLEIYEVPTEMIDAAVGSDYMWELLAA